MLAANLAVVTQVLPDRHGVLVMYRNGVGYQPSEAETGHFVRVLERRAHPTSGMTQCLPEVGELGLVLDVEPGISVWMGSLPWEERNQQDTRSGLEAWRHSSGVQCLVNADGEIQVFHPSGLTITVSNDGQPIEEIQGTMPLENLADFTGADAKPYVSFWHPSEFLAVLDPDGNLSIDSPAKLTGTFKGSIDVSTKDAATVSVENDATVTVKGALSADVSGDATATIGGDLSAEVSGNATLKAQKITLDGPVECTKTLKVAEDATISGKSFLQHKHLGVYPGPAVSGIPQ